MREELLKIKTEAEKERIELDKKFSFIAILRLIVFLVAVVVIFVALKNHSTILLVASLIPVIAFVVLVKFHGDLDDKILGAKAKINVINRFIKRMGNDWKSFKDNGEDFMDKNFDLYSHGCIHVNMREIPPSIIGKKLNDELIMDGKPFDFVGEYRKMFEKEGGSYPVAATLSRDLKFSGVLAELFTFKNGNAFLDGGLTIGDKNYLYHSVVILGEALIDIIHSDVFLSTKEYIKDLKKDNPKLRFDYTMSTCWYADNDMAYRPTLEDFINYKF